MSLGKFSHFQTTFLTLKSFSFKILPFQEQSEIIYKVSSTSRTAVPFPVARKCRIQLSKMLKQIFKIKNPFLCRRYFPQANISCMECKLFSDNLSRAAGLGNNKDKSIEKMLLDFLSWNQNLVLWRANGRWLRSGLFENGKSCIISFHKSSSG